MPTLYLFGDAEPTSAGTITTVFNAAKTLSPTGSIDACFAQGDMTKDSGGMNYTIQALNASSLATVPAYFVIGNHEYNNRSSAYGLIQGKLGKTYTLSKFSGDSSNNTYSFNIGGIHVVVLNIYYNNANGEVSSAMYSWLDADLAAASGFKVVCAHDPMYPKSYHVGNSLDANKTMRDQLQAMFVRNKVNVFMGGHEHFSGVQNISNVFHVCTGSIIPQGTGDKFNTLNYIHIDSTGNLILTRKQNKAGNWTSPTVLTTTIGTGGSVSVLPDMTPSQLAAYNGLSGASSYVAVSGIVYNVSGSSAFSGGKHKTVHTVGQDLTSAFLGKHAMSMISSFPKVANLIAEPTPGTIAKWKCSGSPDYVITRDDTLTGVAGVDYYLSEELAKAACKRPPQIQGNGWDMGIAQATGEWYKLNMRGLVPVKKMFIVNSNESSGYKDKYPRNFQITASADNTNWDDILTMSGNESVDLIIDFPGNLYQYVKIVLTGSDTAGNSWAIGEMSVYTERPILAKYTDDDSVTTYGLYEGDPIKDPKITSKGQAFARAVEEVSMRKNPTLSINSISLRYFLEISPNELLTITVPGTSISQKFVVQKVTRSEGCYGTWNETIELKQL